MATIRKIIAWTLMIPLVLIMIPILVIWVALDWFGDLGVVDWKNIRQERDF